MQRHLFLSPHFDDAVGSCGGTITRLLCHGHAVRIVTVFGGAESEPFSMPARVLHAEWNLEQPVRQRRLEDASACRVLGCERSHLEFPDAIYRRGLDGRHLYPTFEALRGPLAPEDDRLAERVVRELTGGLDTRTVVYCPMAIGGHVDHVVVMGCGRILESQELTVLYYRDFYYDGEGSDAVAQPAAEHVGIALTPAERDRKLAAFSEYRSQISDLFGDPAGMSAYFAGIGSSESLSLPGKEYGVPLAMLRNVLNVTGGSG